MKGKLFRSGAALALLLGLVIPRGVPPAGAQDLLWAAKTPMPTARGALGVATAPNGKLYAIGGLSATGAVLATVQEYDPAQHLGRQGPDAHRTA